jgi:transaldolase
MKFTKDSSILRILLLTSGTSALSVSAALTPGRLASGKSGENLFDLALDDITRAGDLFRPTYDRTNGVDGWVSLEVSPVLAYDIASTLAEAKELFSRARPIPASGL